MNRTKCEINRTVFKLKYESQSIQISSDPIETNNNYYIPLSALEIVFVQ